MQELTFVHYLKYLVSIEGNELLEYLKYLFESNRKYLNIGNIDNLFLTLDKEYRSEYEAQIVNLPQNKLLFDNYGSSELGYISTEDLLLDGKAMDL